MNLQLIFLVIQLFLVGACLTKSGNLSNENLLCQLINKMCQSVSVFLYDGAMGFSLYV